MPKTKSVNAQDHKKLIDSKEKVLIVDVREDVEWNESHIEGSIHIKLGNLANKTDQLPIDVPIILVCRTGNRSSFGATILSNAGFTHVYNLTGGISAWSKSNYPLTK